MKKLIRSICIALLAILAQQQGLMAQYFYLSNADKSLFLYCRESSSGNTLISSVSTVLHENDDSYLWQFVEDGEFKLLENKKHPNYVISNWGNLIPKDEELVAEYPIALSLKKAQNGSYFFAGYNYIKIKEEKEDRVVFFTFSESKSPSFTKNEKKATAVYLTFSKARAKEATATTRESGLEPGHYAITIPSVPTLNADSLKKVAAELKKTDDVEFDSKGYLVKFKKTCDDASYVVYEGKTSPSYADHIRYIKFYTSDGSVFDGLCSELRLKDIYNMTSYNKFWEGLKGVTMITKPESNIYSTFTLQDGSRVTYNEHVGIYKYYQPINEKGDFYEYQVDPIYSFDLQSARSGIIDNFRRSYDQAIVTIKPRRQVTDLHIPASIHYKNGDVYEGTLTVPDEAFFKDKSSSYVRYYNASWWEDPKLLEKINLQKGRMTHSDGTFHIYVNNQIDEFETIRVVKQEEAKKKEEQAALALQTELIKKYGKANMEAFAKGVVTIGMPQELFLLGIRFRQFLLEQSVEVAYQNGKDVTYYVYGFKANSRTITDHGYLGRLHFIDGKLYSKTY